VRKIIAREEEAVAVTEARRDEASVRDTIAREEEEEEEREERIADKSNVAGGRK